MTPSWAQDYILAETLSISCEPVPAKPAGATEWDLNGHPCAMKIEAGNELQEKPTWLN